MKKVVENFNTAFVRKEITLYSAAPRTKATLVHSQQRRSECEQHGDEKKKYRVTDINS